MTSPRQAWAYTKPGPLHVGSTTQMHTMPTLRHRNRDTNDDDDDDDDNAAAALGGRWSRPSLARGCHSLGTASLPQRTGRRPRPSSRNCPPKFDIRYTRSSGSCMIHGGMCTRSASLARPDRCSLVLPRRKRRIYDTASSRHH